MLPLTDWPVGLQEAVRRTGVRRVECVVGDAMIAFCVGVVRPRILITPKLVARLRLDELDAVLLHEEYHRQHRDPLRHALCGALADTVFYAPIVRWWVHHRRASAELRADRAALRAVGPRSLAGALWTVGATPVPDGTAAFQGAVELRVAQILGDPVLRQFPAFSVWFGSVTGIVGVWGLLVCLSHVVSAFQ